MHALNHPDPRPITIFGAFPHRKIGALLTTITIFLGVSCQEPVNAQIPDDKDPRPHKVKVVFFDDFTGGEEGGIHRLSAMELQAFLKALAGQDFTFSYTAIGESAEQQEMVALNLPRLTAMRPEPVATEGLDLSDLTVKTEEYFVQQKAFQAALGQWITEVKPRIQSFQSKVLVEQMKTAGRFDERVALWGDYRRSDVAGAIDKGVREVSSENRADVDERRIFVLNSDGIDSPNGRASRTRPFNESDLPTDIILIFVEPQENGVNPPLFQAVCNQTIRVKTILGAVDWLATATTRKEGELPAVER